MNDLHGRVKLLFDYNLDIINKLILYSVLTVRSCFYYEQKVFGMVWFQLLNYYFIQVLVLGSVQIGK